MSEFCNLVDIISKIYKKPGVVDFDDLNREISDPNSDIHHYVYNKLGIKAASIAILKKKSDEFKILQNPFYQREYNPFPAISLCIDDHQLIKQEDRKVNVNEVSRIIDKIHIFSRNVQRIQRDSTQSNFTPKFISVLLRDHDAFKMVSTGESVFFIYLWLHAIRQIMINKAFQKSPQIGIIWRTEDNPNLRVQQKHQIISDWTRLSKIIPDLYKIEKSAFNAIKYTPDYFKEHDLENEKNLIKLVCKSLKLTTCQNEHSILNDWLVLGLVKKSNNELYLKSNFLNLLIKYLISLPKNIKGNSISQSKNNINKLNSICEKKELNCDDISAIHKIIIQVSNIKIIPGRNNPPIVQFLQELHNKANFPIIPYFFQYLFSGKHHSHLMIPLIYFPDNSYTVKLDGKDIITTDLSAVALMSCSEQALDAAKATEIRMFLNEIYKNSFVELLYSEVIGSDRYTSFVNTLSHETNKAVTKIFEMSKWGLYEVAQKKLTEDGPAEIHMPKSQEKFFDDCLLIPNPKNRFRNIIQYLIFWFGRKGITSSIFKQRSSELKLEESIHIIIDLCWNIKVTIDNLGFDIETIDRIMKYNPDKPIEKGNIEIIIDDILRDKILMTDRTNEKINDYILVLFATILNIFKHNENKGFTLHLRHLNHNENPDHLGIVRHSFSNPAKPLKDSIRTINKKDGTEDHLKNILNGLPGGKLLYFDYHIDSTGKNFFNTEFDIDQRILFSS